MTDQDPTSLEATQVVETPAPLTPVAPVATPPGASRSRWVVALGAVALVTALTAAIVYALVGRSPEATVLGYVPSGAVVYGELRLDLPGDQRREVGEFLSHFPGFADQAALDSKLDEVLDRLISDASDGKQTFTTNIKPWFDGELAFSAGPLPDPKTFTASPEDSGRISARALALLSIKDEALARAWFADAIGQSGATTTTETYAGVELTIFAGPSGDAKAAFAILDGKVAVAGDVDSVKAAVDTKGDGGLRRRPRCPGRTRRSNRRSHRARLPRARPARGVVAAGGRRRRGLLDADRSPDEVRPGLDGLLGPRRRRCARHGVGSSEDGGEPRTHRGPFVRRRQTCPGDGHRPRRHA